MTNGKMEESIKRAATLIDIEPTVFEQLAKYAYQGSCGISDGVVAEPVSMLQKIPILYRCHACGSTNVRENTQYPFCSATCREKFNSWLTQPSSDFNIHYSLCVAYDCRKNFLLGNAGRLLCESHNSKWYNLVYPHIGLGPVANHAAQITST